MRHRHRRLWIYLAQVALAVALLALLWRNLDGAAAFHLLAAADARWLAAALLALTLQTFLSTLRWRLTAARLGQHMTFGWALREYYLAQFVNQTLPGGMVGDAGRAFRSRGNGGLARSSQAVIFERLAGQLALFLVMASGVAFASVTPHGPDLPAGAFLLMLPVGAAIVAAMLALRFAPKLPGRIGQICRGLRRSVAMVFWGRRILAVQVLLNLGATTCNILAFVFCASATGTGLSPSAAMILVPLILYAMVVPLTVSGWGIREGVAAALFPLAGASASAGLAASTAFGLIFLASTLPGLFVLFARGGTDAPQEAGCPPAPASLPSTQQPLS